VSLSVNFIKITIFFINNNRKMFKYITNIIPIPDHQIMKKDGLKNGDNLQCHENFLLSDFHKEIGNHLKI
jgi:hypothetical protein